MSLLYLSLEGTVSNANQPRLLELLLGHSSSMQAPYRMKEAVYSLELKEGTNLSEKYRAQAFQSTLKPFPLSKITNLDSSHIKFHQILILLTNIYFPGNSRELRARSYLDLSGDTVWTLRQSDKQVYSTQSTDVRSLREVKVSDNIETFMDILGAKFVASFSRKSCNFVA